MGLLKGLLGLPLAPVRGTVAVAEVVLAQAEEEFYDPARIRAELDEVARRREEGLIAEDDARQIENALVERLMIGQARGREGRHG